MNPFSESMSKKSTEDLIRILNFERDVYQELAINAAQIEIINRNISEFDYDLIKNKLLTEAKIKERIESLSASKSQRFINFLIDVSIVFLFANFFFQNVKELEIRLIFKLAITILPFVFNYIFMEIAFQKTIGKIFTNTKVVDEYGEKPQNSQIYQRAFFRLIPWEPFTFLHSYYKDSRFHDTMSKTKVIKN